MKVHGRLGMLLVALSFVVLVGLQGTAYGQWTRYTIDNSANNGGLIGADGVKFGDINNDGIMDITTGWEGGGKSRVYKHPGYATVTNGSCWPSVTACDTATDVEDAAFMDLDGDGWQDVVSACEGGHNRIYINWGPTSTANYMNPAYWTGGYVPQSTGTGYASYWMYSHPMNVDNQNTMDFLSCGKTSGFRKISWFKAPSSPRTLANWIQYQIGYCGWGMSMFTNDMDNDGDLDVLLSDRDSIVWYEYPGPGGAITSQWTAHIIYLNNEGTGEIDGDPIVRTPRTMFLDVGDLDQDGLQDIVCSLWDKDQETHNYILFMKRLDSTGLSWQKCIYNYEPNNWKGMQIADINCDGKMDLVVTQESAVGAEDIGCYWLNYSGTLTTNATWTKNNIAGTPGIKFDQCRVYDMDNDGDLDVVTCEESEEVAGGPANEGLGTFWYRNPTNPATTYMLTVTSGDGDGKYAVGAAVNIAAGEPPAGQVFSSWTGNVNTVENIYSQATSMIMPAQNATVTATFSGATTYTLTVNSGTGDGSYSQGAVVNIAAATPPAGYVFDEWTGNTAYVADIYDATTTVTMPAANVTVTATYIASSSYTLTVNSGTGDGTYTSGTVVNIVANTPPTGYAFSQWTGDVATVANVNASSTTITMPSFDATVTATYAVIGTGAFIEASGMVVCEAEHYTSSAAGTGVAAGQTWQSSDVTGDVGTTMIVLPNTGVTTGDGSSDGARIDFDVNFSTTGVYYALLRMPAMAGADNSVNIGFDSSVLVSNQGHTNGDWRWKKVTTGMTISSIGHHTFNIWEREDGTPVDRLILTTNNSYTLADADAGPAESSRESGTTYTLTVVSGTGDGSYAQGAVVSISADTPPTNYHFNAWTGSTAYVANVNSASTTVTMPASNISVTATYAANPTYALTVTSGTGDGNYYQGQVVNISADAPQSGYTFASWTGATAYVANVNASSTTVTMPAQAITVTATYSAVPTYTLTVNSGTGDGSYTQSTVVNISADAPQSGYVFSAWTGSTSYVANVNSANTTVTMPASNITVTATYTASSGAFQEASGMVVMEAEHYTGLLGGTGAGVGTYWDDSDTTTGASNSLVMVACPDNNDPRVNLNTTEGARMDFLCNFSTTGTYYVHVRIPALSTLDDSLHVGLDSTRTHSGLTNASGAWAWVKLDQSSVTSTVSVASTGEHTFNIWLRENGVRVDKVVLTTNSSYIPTGTGPAESSH